VWTLRAHGRRAVAEHVAEHEHRWLLRRQMLKANDERQLDRLLRFVASLWAGRLVGYVLKQDVGVGLQPDRLAVAGGVRTSRSSVAAPRRGAGSPAGHRGNGSSHPVQPDTD
jgi:hypothetical protein